MPVTAWCKARYQWLDTHGDGVVHYGYGLRSDSAIVLLLFLDANRVRLVKCVPCSNQP
jgi:hypothetical protein